ncbi:MAG TPA: TM2 domain-containing protein [Ktedonobacteraceae bacterium]|nr:TM2 domain-containing protein [Ktedonobacteraceae bacterium]
MDNFRPYDPREPQQQQQQQQAEWQTPPQPWSPQQGQWQAPPQPQPQYQEWQAPQQPWSPQYSQYPGAMMGMGPQKNWLATMLLCHFLGMFGVHRFYTGRVVSGIFQLLTFGGLGIWTLVDLVMIITGDFKDNYGRPLNHQPVMGGNRSWSTTALLCLFLGWLGVHRFYTGHVVSGIFMLLTGGGFGIWTLVDLIMIYTDSFTDDSGMLLTRMDGAMPNVR